MTQTIKVQDIVLNNMKSLDGPPLDFSFKNIKNLNELKYIEPRSGKRKPLQIIQDENQQENKDIKDQSVQQEEKDEKQYDKQEDDQDNLEQKENEQNEDAEKNEKEKIEQSKKGPQIVRLIPQNNINQIIAQYNIPLNSQVQSKVGNNANKNFEEIKIIQQKKIVQVHLVCSTLILSYNQIRSLESINFYPILNSVMIDCSNLAWIDLSHNYLTDLNYDFSDFPQLKSLYLHSNYISNFNVLKKLKCPNLKQMTIHGNPIETIQNFRLIVLSIIKTLKKLDTVLVSKKELDNADYLINNQKGYKYPQVNNPLQPPEIQVQQDQKNKN